MQLHPFVGLRRKLRSPLAAVVLAGSVAVGPTSPGGAQPTQTACGPGPSSLFTGQAYVGTTNYYGASANIAHRRGFICDGWNDPHANFNMAWSMLAGTRTAYAQVGVMRGWNQPANMFFTEHRNASGAWVRRRLFDVSDGINRFWSSSSHRQTASATGTSG